MKTNKTLLAMMAILVAMAPVAMAVDFAPETPDTTMEQVPVQFDSTEASVTTTRTFNVTEAADAYLFLAPGVNDQPPLPEGYSVDIVATTDGGLTFVTIADNLTTTDISPLFNVPSGAELTMTLNMPLVREANTHVLARLIISLDDSANAGGNGGTMDPSISHTLDVFFYDQATDSDADGLPDAWEDEHFGNLDQLASDDPDGDGYNNGKEYEAGTDPNNAASVPVKTYGSGGYTINDRELGLVIAGFFLTAIIMAGLVLFLPRKDEKKAMAIAGTLSISLLATMVLLFLLDVMEVGGNGWAWWSYLGVTWQETFVGLVSLAALGIAAAITFAKLNEKKEVKAAYAYLAAGVVVFGGLFLLFNVFGVPVPFIG